MRFHPTRGLVRVVAPAAEPLALVETKEFLRVEHSDDDARISDMIVTARTLAEQWMRRSLVTQSWKLTQEEAIYSTIRLPMGPGQSITSVTTTSENGTVATVPTSEYALSASRESLVITTVITGFRIDITYAAGYGTTAQVPRPIKLGMLSHVAALYDGRAGLVPIPDEVLSCYMPFREFGT